MLGVIRKIIRIISLRDVCSYLKMRERILLGISFLMDIVFSAAKVLAPAAFGKAIDMISHSEQECKYMGINFTPTGLLYVAIACYSTTLIPHIKQLMFAKLCDVLTAKITDRLVRKTHELPLGLLSQRDTEICQSHFFALSRAPELALETVNGIIPSGLDSITGIAIAWYLYGGKVGGGLLAYGLGSTVVFNGLLSRISKAKERGERIDRALNTLTTQTYKVLKNMETVRLFDRSSSEIQEFHNDLGKYLKSKRELRVIETIVDWVVNFLPVIGTGILVALRNGFFQNDLGEFIFLFNYLPCFCNSLGKFNQSLNQASIAIEGFDQVKDILLQQGVDGEMLPRTLFPCFWNSVRVAFNKVSFSYDEKNRILTDVSFDIEPGQTVVLVGETGAGKTTMIKLLSGLYEPTAGTIKINGVDIREIPIKNFRKHLGVVPQEVTVFSDKTLKENVLYALPENDEIEEVNPDELQEVVVKKGRKSRNHHRYLPLKPTKKEKGQKISDDEYRAAIQMARIQHLDTRGYCKGLSGGERQRVGIARLFIRGASNRIVLLDEPLKSLDVDTGECLWPHIQGVMQGKTSVVVSHFPHILSGANKVLFFNEGRVKEKVTDNGLKTGEVCMGAYV